MVAARKSRLSNEERIVNGRLTVGGSLVDVRFGMGTGRLVSTYGEDCG